MLTFAALLGLLTCQSLAASWAALMALALRQSWAFCLFYVLEQTLTAFSLDRFAFALVLSLEV